ncbi:hypothetical protein ABUE34_15700 (plasmid) [Kozakia baliensis]|uniref:hypothetical protein n=1 Tax=Kozakia baliensis TaxID=153496 RepID=UPI00345C2BB3
MSNAPDCLTIPDHAARWGIEPMFSDFKSRGFGLGHSQLRTPKPLGRLMMMMSIALYFAVSTGCGMLRPSHPWTKKRPQRQPANLNRGKLSWFTRGARRIVRLMQFCGQCRHYERPGETDGW